MKSDSLMLVVSHSIFLTETERAILVAGEDITTTGVSVPVWYKKGSTSEPAVEVFATYTLHNTKDFATFVIKNKEGYEINLPQQVDDYEPPKELSDRDWLKRPRRREHYYEVRELEPRTGSCLADPCAYLRFFYHDKRKFREEPLTISHIIEIQDMKVLTESLVD